MITAPGAAMLDSKLFVSRLDNPWPDLYERWWDGLEWIWINHGRPNDVPMKGAPGAAMLDEKLFVVTDDGSLWERHWRADLGRWAWEDHGRPDNREIVAGPGAAMLDEKLFVVTDDGSLWERHWRADLDRWAWEDHGRPDNREIVAGPGAAMLDEKLFVVTDDGSLWERHWRADLGRWAWEDHGRPDNREIVAGPGAAMMDEKLFVCTDDGALWERHWRSDLGRWAWEDHGKPPGTKVDTAPGAAMLDAKLFVGAKNGHLFERLWTGSQWTWVDHGKPPGTKVETAPGAAMMNSKLFIGGKNGHLFERTWDGEAWLWVDHGTAFHDQSAHVMGKPGADPALTVAVMGDGYDESDMNAYHRHVDNLVVAAFGKDQLGDHADKVRLIRIDVASPVSGVTTRDYDEKGTPAKKADDELTSETYRDSRLGYVSTGIWSHCWIETSPRTKPRIESIRQRFAPAATNVVVLVNNSREGGCNRGDIAVFTKSESANVVAHELGHNLFGLGDEYTNDDKDFTGTARQPNLSERPAAWSELKWRDLVDGGTPLPTDADDPPKGWKKTTSVGAFEGGNGNFATGVFRPVLRCRMNQNSPPWCPVCARAIDQAMGAYE